MSHKSFKIIIALVISLLLVILLTGKFFLTDSPKINQLFMANLITSFKSKNKPTPPIIAPTTIPITTIPSITKIIKKTPTKIPVSVSPVFSPTPIKPKSSPTPIPSIYVPTPTNTPIITATPITCPTTSSESYEPFRVNSDISNPPAANHPDININIRGYSPATGPLQLLDIDGPTDDKSPRLTGFIKNNPNPKFIKLYRVNDWNWNTNARSRPITDPAASLFGLAVNPGDTIQVPDSQYDMGGGYQVLVLYATPNGITIKYTPDDNVVVGYAIHIENFCVDPNLLALYEQLDSKGRSELPGLRGKQILGYAQSNEIKIAIRDTGAFMDVRSRKDWW